MKYYLIVGEASGSIIEKNTLGSLAPSNFAASI